MGSDARGRDGVLGGSATSSAGILFSDLVTTVSPTYALEIQTPELAVFDGILAAQVRGLVGILNGIDYDQWDRRVI